MSTSARKSARSSEFAKNLDAYAKSVRADPNAPVIRETNIYENPRIVKMCSNTTLIIAVVVPLAVWAFLWFATPTWFTKTVNGVVVKDNQKIALTVIAVAIVTLLAVWGMCGRSSC